MKCIHCQGTDSKVVDSRNEGGGVMRRRECKKCGKRFTTHEYTDLTWETKRVDAMAIAPKAQMHVLLAYDRLEKAIRLMRGEAENDRTNDI